MLIRYTSAAFIMLGLLVPVAGASNRKAHIAGKHPKPARHVAAVRPYKRKPHRAE